MNFLEAFTSATGSLRAHRLRTGLTMLGMLFGVASVIAMLSIGTGAARQAASLLSSMGLHDVLVHGKKHKPEELQEIRKRSTGLSLRDARAIQQAVPNVASTSPTIGVEAYQVISATGQTRSRVLGVKADHASRLGLPAEEGRFFDPSEESSGAQVCVLGSRARRELFGFGPAMGEDIKVNDVWLTVIGVLPNPTTQGEALLGVPVESTASQILIPLTTARRKFEHDPLEDELDEIRVTLRSDADPVESAAVIETLLDRLHGGEGDYDLTVPRALLDRSRRTQRLFNIVMGCIASISLLVGGIGIMNIMLATVLERTAEIGLRRAVGARRSDVRNQFMVEAFALSLAGGAAGILLGILLARGVAAYAGWATVVTPFSILLAAGVCVAVGLLFGIYPAHRAAQLSPIEALRHE
jgi:putative ABC transport system permease protein